MGLLVVKNKKKENKNWQQTFEARQKTEQDSHDDDGDDRYSYLSAVMDIEAKTTKVKIEKTEKNSC
ncbi:hypothetical protein DERF_004653 [Dermatophagoides farinae]|uniref:Uncharacterized protein n=1 Tax=Dermatophagoides farinae TaxID=6954 RepID=A0A922I4C5_DERFA|nr:hypothetical protein DERF_004653 [Dermatophagoides farinae]